MVDSKSTPSSVPEGVPRPAGLPKTGQPEQVSRLMALHQRMQGKWYWRVPPNHSKPIYHFLGIGLGASMWFWIMYRAKKDGAVLLGLKHPWDH